MINHKRNASPVRAASCCLLILSAFAAGNPPSSGKAHAKVPYAKVEPLVKAKCISCHNPDRHPEEVDLSSYKATMKSGDHGPIVVPGHPEKSKFIQYVDGTKQPIMPFKGKPLSKAEVALLKKWVASGASN